MVIDWFFNLLFSIAKSIIDFLPPMPPKPFNDNDLNAMWSFFGGANYWFPIMEIVNSLDWIFTAFSVLMGWKLRKSLKWW